MNKTTTVALFLALMLCCAGCAAPATPTQAPTADAAGDAQGQDDSALQGLDGTVYTLEGLCAGKQLVMLNFWAYWCGPCVSAMPALQRLQQAYAQKGVQLVGVYVDDSDMQATKDAIANAGVTYPIVAMNASLAALARDVSAIPTTLFLDGDGNLVAKAVGSRSYDQWQQIVDELLQQ